MNSEEYLPKRKPGRPRMETTMPPQWYEIIVESGREGKHITDYLIKLGISWEGHYELLKRNERYSEAFKEYNKLCEQWWYNKAHESIANNESNKFNQRLWMQIMKSKFKDNWRDEKHLDLTTQGDKITEENPVKIEIIRRTFDGNQEIL